MNNYLKTSLLGTQMKVMELDEIMTKEGYGTEYEFIVSKDFEKMLEYDNKSIVYVSEEGAIIIKFKIINKAKNSEETTIEIIKIGEM